MSTASTAQSRNGRLHREDWLRHALETLRRSGESGLRVEPLARSLGVTTGSFYWHFKDRQDLLDQVIDHWATKMTQAIAERMTSDEHPRSQLSRLLEDVTRLDRDRYEIAVRNWAAFDAKAARAVRTVDECRMAYVKGLFLNLGFSDDQAQIRANMLVFYQLGEAGFSMKDSEARRLELVEMRLAILLCPTEGTASVS